jgi:putative nucleotidyltransferase-like protein
MSSSNPGHQKYVRRLLDVVLRTPDAIAEMTDKDLDLTLRVTRRVRLLGRLALDLQEAGLFESLPQEARDQLQSAVVLADSRARLARWELDRIAWALTDHVDTHPIVMKGCAYLLLEMPNARGRIFADVDLMLPETELEEIEAHLNRCGWLSGNLSPYDQNYYRNWTHELPPLVHVEREVEIDLHHNILPRTARLKPAGKELLQAAKPLPDSRYRVLADEDIALHAMTHLMFGDDLVDKLRELVDIDDLLRHFAGADDTYWQSLVVRAEELDLRRPAYYALRYARQLLDCPVPDSIVNKTRDWAPPAPVIWLMDRLVPSALYPPHPDYPSWVTEFGRLLLFVRSHWIRMPPWLLAYHLSYKFYLTRIRKVSRPVTNGSGGQ